MKTIDLGYSYPTGSDMPEPVNTEATKEEPKVHYPSLYLSNLKDFPDLPDEGEATIKFKVVSKSTQDHEGEKTSSIELEIQSITPCCEKTKSESKSEDSMEEIESGLSESEKTPKEEKE